MSKIVAGCEAGFEPQERMTPEMQAMRDEVAALMLRVARPLIWHDPSVGWPRKVDGATCFFLRFERGIVGVTADHVVSAYERAAEANPRIICQLRISPRFDLLGAIIARDPKRDIVTFAVPEAVSSHIEAIPLDCRGGSWPPPEPQRSSLISASGFPEAIRTVDDPGHLQSGAWGALAVVDSVTCAEILTIYDPAIARPAAWAPVLPSVGFNMSGCSGGPVLMHGIRNSLHRWFPVALITQGSKDCKKQGAATEFDMIRLSRIDIIQPDGTIMNSQERDTGWLPG
jgi:hypothetical protein